MNWNTSLLFLLKFKSKSKFVEILPCTSVLVTSKNSPFLILEPCSSSLDFNNTNKKAVVEKEAILRFLVALSGSGTSESPGVLGHHKDLWVKESTQVINITACHVFFLEFCVGLLLARHKVRE